MANNTNDITKTGPKSYRDLQKENDAAYQSALNESSIAKKMNFNRSYAPSTSFIYEGKEQSPILQQHTGDYWGNSMFDNPTANEEEFQLNNLNDTRAENQPWYAQLGAGIGKGIVLAGTTFLDGTVGLLAGIGTAISEGRWSGLFDNVVSNCLNEINRQIEDILPNYRTQEEQERPWYENLGTVNFWADSFLKNLGFTVGAFYSGGLFLKALKGIKWLHSGLRAALTGSIFSAVNEGRVEANNTMHDLLELHTQQLRDAYNKRYSEIINSSMSDIDKQKALAELDANFDKEDAKNIDNARLAGDIDLLGNTILLSLDNFNTYGRLFARGFKNAEKTAQNSLRTAARHADEKLSSRIIRNADGSYGFNKYGAKDLAKSGLKTAALEGNEEMAQQFLSNFSGNVRSYDSPDAYYNALLDSNAEQKTMDFTKSLAQAFADSYGDGSQWEQFAVGALTGILGVPTFGRVNNSDSNTYLGRGKVIGLSGGIFGEMGQNREANQRGQEIANRMNSFAQKLKDHQRYFTQSQSFTDAMDGFAEDGNAFEFKNAEDNEAFSAMSAFAQAGRLDDYKQMVNADFDNMSDEDLDAIAKMTSQDTDDDSSAKDQGWRNADGTYMSETEEGRQQMKYELNKKRDKILSQIDAYTDSLDKVRGIGNNSLTDDQVNELAWLDWKVGQFNDRLKQVTSEANAPFKSIKEGVDYMIQALEKEHDSIINDGDKDKKDKDGNNILKENEKQQAKYKNISNVLTQLINADLKGLASIKSEDFNDAIKEMNSTKFFNDFNAYSDVTATDYGDALTSVVDTFKLLSARNEFNKRLKEFTEDPLKLIQNRQKIDKKKAKTDRTKHAVKTKDKVDNASVSDIVSQMESGDITDDDFDSLLNEVDASLDEEDDSISSTKGKINAVKDIIESSHRAEDKLDNLADDSDVEGLAEEVQQAVQDAKSLLAASKSKANSKDELFDTESEAWNNPNNLPITDEVQQMLSEMSPEEQDDFLQGRIDRAKNAMEKVKSFIYDEDKESSKMPNTKEQAKNKKAAEEGEKKRREDDKEASGTVASSDSDSPGASVTKVNLSGEQPKEPDTTANLSARELLKDIELPEGTTEDTYNAGDNLLMGADYAWRKGLRKKDLFDAITSTESWKKASQTVSEDDLGKVINNYLTKKYNLKPKAKPKAKAGTNNDEETSEVRTPVSNSDENAKEVKGQWNTEPEKVELGYWKPTTTEIGIHDDASNPHPFYETAQVINSVFNKNFKDLDPYEQFVFDHYIKPGYIRHKYNDKQLQSMKAVYEYLKNEKHAFDQVNKGFVKKDTTIHFAIDNKLNKDAGEIIVLMTLGDGTVVGDLSGKDAADIINEYKDKFKEEENRPDLWTSDTTATVSQLMRGKVPYSVETHNVNDVFKDSDESFKLGISMGNGNNAPIVADAGRTKAQGRSDFEKTIVSPLNAVLGQPYILLPTAGKTLRMCVPFNMKRFTKETADSQLGKAIKSVISTIPDGTDKDNAMSVKTGLEELLAAEFHVNYDKDNNGNDIVRIHRKMYYDNHQETTIYNGPIANENLVQNIVDALCKDGGTPFEVSRKYVNSKYNLNGTPISYNKMIGEVSDVNLPLGTTSTINDWFILTPPNGKVKRVKSTKKNPAATTAGSIRTVNVNGVGDVQVNTNPKSSWRIVSSAKPLTEEQESIARAIAYGETNPLVDNTKPYETRWGVFDPNTQTFQKSEDKGGVVVKHFSLGPEEEISHNDNDNGKVAGKRTLGESFKEVGLENGEFAGTISTNDSRHAVITDDGQVKLYDGVELKHTQAEIIRRKARRVFEDPNATEQQLHDAIVSAAFKTKANATVLYYLYKALNAVKQSKMTVDEAMALLEYHMYVDDDVHKKLLSILDSPEQGNEEQQETEEPNKVVMTKEHEVSGNLDDNAKNIGLLTTPEKELAWGALNDPQKQAILDKCDWKNNEAGEEANRIMGTLAKSFNARSGKFKHLNVDEFLGVGKNRLVTTKKYTPWKPEKELGWLKKALPQFSDDEHLRITNGLIKLDGRRKAYGRFKQGVIYLSDAAARGTVYHEAFHAVFNTLLNNDEQTDVMNAARAKYGDLGSIQLEENLAEDFRRYIQWEQTPVLGTLIKAFRTIKHIVFGLLNKNSVLDKLYYNISRGRFANKVAGTTNADRPRLYAPDINDAIHKLDSDYRRGKQLEGTISSNMKSVIDKFIKDNDLKDVAYATKYNNSDKWVMRVTKKNYNEKRNFLMSRLNRIYNSELSSDERNSEKALLEQEEREDEQFNRAIEQWHRDKLMYGNLSEDDKLYLQERGISIDEYNEMSPFEKEILFRCKY